jgi:uncharacterized membrane protein
MITYLAFGACLLGLIASVYILRKKSAKKKLVCPLRADCEKVIHSTHSTTLGISNEVLGIGYYLIVAALYASTLMAPSILPPGLAQYLLIILSICGGLFSLYLVALQALVIRAWCSWCMLSALATAVLVFCSFHIPLASIAAFLDQHRDIWLLVHGIGFILGLGSATITDVLFFRFLKDHQISGEEQDSFEAITRIIWVGLAILVLSGIMLYLSDVGRLSVSPKFLIKLVVVGVIIVNGLLLNLIVSPRLRQLSFDGTLPARHFRRLAFALGGISIVSWYSAFILGSARGIPLSFVEGLAVYGILLIGTIIGSQVFERRMTAAFNR